MTCDLKRKFLQVTGEWEAPPPPPGAGQSPGLQALIWALSLWLSSALFQRTDLLIPTYARLPCIRPSLHQTFASALQSPSSVIKLLLNFGLFWNVSSSSQHWPSWKWTEHKTIRRCLLFPLAGVFLPHMLGWRQLMVRVLLLPSWWYRLTKCLHPHHLLGRSRELWFWELCNIQP